MIFHEFLQWKEIAKYITPEIRFLEFLTSFNCYTDEVNYSCAKWLHSSFIGFTLDQNVSKPCNSKSIYIFISIYTTYFLSWERIIKIHCRYLFPLTWVITVCDSHEIHQTIPFPNRMRMNYLMNFLDWPLACDPHKVIHWERQTWKQMS